MSAISLLNNMTRRIVPASALAGGAVPRTEELFQDLPEDFLKSLLDAKDRQPQGRRLGDAESLYPDYMHVSSLVGACARQHALSAGDDRVHYESVTGGHRVMWAFGRAVEHHVRTSYLEATGGGTAFGKWRCVCGVTTHRGQLPNITCQNCTSRVNIYGELTLFDHSRKLMGNPDLLFMHGRYMVPVEIKSMNSDEWNKLKAPKGDHLMQLGCYHHLLGTSELLPAPVGIVIYVTKDFKFGSPYKEYRVSFSDRHVAMNISEAIAVAQSVAAYRDGANLPPRTRCSAHTDTRAKSCPYVVSCFSME